MLTLLSKFTLVGSRNIQGTSLATKNRLSYNVLKREIGNRIVSDKLSTPIENDPLKIL